MTYREIVYMVLDLLKERSDDAYYTEEHVMFLADKVRALVLGRRLRASRNKSFVSSSGENTQTIELRLEPASVLPAGCGGDWLRSTVAMPEFLYSEAPVEMFSHDMVHTMVTFIPACRMRYVGHDRWLQNIIWASKSSDDHLYLFSNNPKFIHLERINMTSIFAEPRKVAAMMNGGKVCEPLDVEFPLQSDLVAQCIEIIVQELAGSKYVPEDKRNNAKDDSGEAQPVGTSRTTAAQKADE